ncbi:MAG: hypothetical protein WC794_03330 [Candidatus Doudnabacteria bacterium]|jgi:hypothetical protein
MQAQAQALNLNELVALFLAETIRSRRTSLARAAEISQQVVDHLPSLKSEDQILSALTEIEKDFQEVTALKQALHFGYRSSDIKVYEPEIRDFASNVFSVDMQKSAAFLADAAKLGMTIERLCLQYPDFSQYLAKNSDKSSLLGDLANK